MPNKSINNLIGVFLSTNKASIIVRLDILLYISSNLGFDTIISGLFTLAYNVAFVNIIKV